MLAAKVFQRNVEVDFPGPVVNGDALFHQRERSLGVAFENGVQRGVFRQLPGRRLIGGKRLSVIGRGLFDFREFSGSVAQVGDVVNVSQGGR